MRFNQNVDVKSLDVDDLATFDSMSLTGLAQSQISSATINFWGYSISALSHNAGATLAADGSSSIVGLSSTLARLIAQLHYQGIVKASIS